MSWLIEIANQGKKMYDSSNYRANVASYFQDTQWLPKQHFNKCFKYFAP